MARQPFRCPERDERFEWSSNPLAAVAPAPPDFTGYGYEVGEPLLDGGLTPFSYGYNAAGTSDLTAAPGLGMKEVKASLVKAAWDMVAIGDSDGADGTGFENLFLNVQIASICPPGTIHFGGANVLFCDGHVQRYVRTEITLPAHVDISDPNQKRIAMMWNRNHSW